MKTIRPKYFLPAAVVLLVLLGSMPATAEQAGEFAGTWMANGTWESLEFSEGREVLSFKLSGHLNLQSDVGNTSDYWSEVIGIWDEETGVNARVVWRHTGGKAAAYAVLTGRMMEEGAEMTGTFVGGRGALAGLTGSFTFTWASVFRSDQGHVVSCYSKDIEGTYQIP